jgi:predicted transcriptional regulator
MAMYGVLNKGAVAILEVLYSMNGKVSERAFITEISNRHYYMLYARGKQPLINAGLIDFQLENYDKIIVLTDKGKKVAEKIVEINEILKQQPDTN